MASMINGELHWDYKEYLYVLLGTQRSIIDNSQLDPNNWQKNREDIDSDLDRLCADLSVYGTKKVRIPVNDLTPDLPEYYRKLYNLDKLAVCKMFDEIGAEADKQLEED
tara:strand:- start:717 stop:1043 length:327 start_codon:yes stop_codon:yes gene_type:complete